MGEKVHNRVSKFALWLLAYDHLASVVEVDAGT